MSSLIVLVEDNEDDIEITRRALAENRIANDLVVLRDGLEAVEWFQRSGRHRDRDPDASPAVVLLDLKLPFIDGHGVLAAIRAIPRWRLLPVVILTSSRAESDRVKGYEEGANSFLVKPVDFASFTEAVRTLGVYWLLLNQRATPSPATGEPGPRPHDAIGTRVD